MITFDIRNESEGYTSTLVLKLNLNIYALDDNKFSFCFLTLSKQDISTVATEGSVLKYSTMHFNLNIICMT